MTVRAPGAAALALIAGLAAACGEPEVSDLSYASVRSAAEGKDEAAFRSWFETVRGQRVAWRGRVVEIRTEHGDEFVEITLVEVDVDGLDGGTTDADVVFQVSASFAEDLAAGNEVAFTGTIDDFEWQNRRPRLRLDVKQVRGV
jgi:hypothetical protein